MRDRLLFVAAALILAWMLDSPARAAQPAESPVFAHAARIQHAVEGGMMVRAIDSAYASGALTFDEARALYAEQAAIRHAWIQARAAADPARATARVAYMIRTAQGTLARVSYNRVQRTDTSTPEVAAWE